MKEAIVHVVWDCPIWKHFPRISIFPSLQGDPRLEVGALNDSPFPFLGTGKTCLRSQTGTNGLCYLVNLLRGIFFFLLKDNHETKTDKSVLFINAFSAQLVFEDSKPDTGTLS